MSAIFFKILTIFSITLASFFALFSSPKTEEFPSPSPFLGEPKTTPYRGTSTTSEEKNIASTTEKSSFVSTTTPSKKVPINAGSNIVPVHIPKVKPPLLPFPLLNDALRNATVNIFCTSKTSGPFNPISGTGVIIDPRGVILTNAHVGQYLLLKDIYEKDFVNCSVRTGSPATLKYHVKLLYLPPSWIDANKKNIAKEIALGTGEEDYAFLFITETTSGDSLPASFPFVETSRIGDGFIDYADDGILVAAYSSGFLGGIEIQKDLSLTSTTVTVKNFFTFKESTVDLISLGGSIIAQKGSSGGGVYSRGENAVIGIIATATAEDSTANRDVRAISIAHIERSLAGHTGKSIREYLQGDLFEKVQNFDLNLFGVLKEALELELKK